MLSNGKLIFQHSMLQQWVFFVLFIPPFLKFITIWGNICLPWDGVSPQATIPAAASRAPHGEGTWHKIPTSWEGMAAPSLLCSPQGRGSLVPKIKWSVVPLAGWQVLPVAPGLGVVAQSLWLSPSHCLIVKPIKGGCLFLLASSKSPGASPASEGCLGDWGPSFSNIFISPPMYLCPGPFAVPSPACRTPSNLPLLAQTSY